MIKASATMMNVRIMVSFIDMRRELPLMRRS
jgi:hypothetical protein